MQKKNIFLSNTPQKYLACLNAYYLHNSIAKKALIAYNWNWIMTIKKTRLRTWLYPMIYQHCESHLFNA